MPATAPKYKSNVMLYIYTSDIVQNGREYLLCFPNNVAMHQKPRHIMSTSTKYINVMQFKLLPIISACFVFTFRILMLKANQIYFVLERKNEAQKHQAE